MIISWKNGFIVFHTPTKQRPARTCKRTRTTAPDDMDKSRDVVKDAEAVLVSADATAYINQLEMIHPPVPQRYKRGPRKYGELKKETGAIEQTSIITTFNTVATTLSSISKYL